MLHLIEPEVDFRSVLPGARPDQDLLRPPHSSPSLPWGFRISRMRNSAVFPSLSVAETDFSYIANSEVAAEFEKLGYGGGLFLNSQLCYDFQLRNFPSLPAFSCALAGDGLVPIAASEGSSNTTNTTSPMRHSSASSSGGGKITMDDDRKHKITGDQVADASTRPMKDLKRRKIMQTEVKLHAQPLKDPSMEVTQPLKAPVKRSQKLGDKVTALQQLVSPFGKTDTASVLHEATVYIKVLQEQIQVLSAPYFGVKSSSRFQGGGEKKLDLSSRGLCLVPIESTIKVTKEYFSDQISTGRTTKRTLPHQY